MANEKNLSIEPLPNEEWRDVVGYEGLYQVSNMGRVKSLPKFRKTRFSYISKERLLKPRWSGEKGHLYLTVLLCRDYSSKNIRVHRLVALHFCDNPKGYVEVNHKDEDKSNNKADNLEWCSRSYNLNYGSGNYKRAMKIKKPVVAIDNYGNEYMRFNGMIDAANYIRCHPASISHACTEGTTICGYKWKRLGDE